MCGLGLRFQVSFGNLRGSCQTSASMDCRLSFGDMLDSEVFWRLLMDQGCLTSFHAMDLVLLYLRRSPHPGIVNMRVNRDYIRGLSYSHYTTITGRGVPPHVSGSRKGNLYVQNSLQAVCWPYRVVEGLLPLLHFQSVHGHLALS